MITRYLYNKAIINKLQELIEEYPDLRFGQLLVNCGIITTFEDDSGRIVAFDPFYTESEKTWQRVINSNFCKKYCNGEIN